MPYVLTARALQDFDNIYQYTVKRHGVKQARKYKDGLEQAMEKIAANPQEYRRVKTADPSIRAINVGNHLVFGAVRPEKPMFIIAILHQRMNIISRLQDRL